MAVLRRALDEARGNLSAAARSLGLSRRAFEYRWKKVAGASGDDERTHADVRELYWRRTFGDTFDLFVGVRKVFWGVTETFHLVDIVNQTDAVEDIDEEDKLGQPMVHFALQRNWGRMDLIALTGFRERTFPGVEGRPRTPLPVDTDVALYESAAGNRQIDGAIRYSHFIGNWDLGAYLFHGTSREPRFLPDLAGERLVPIYDVIDQLGVDRRRFMGAARALVDLPCPS